MKNCLKMWKEKFEGLNRLTTVDKKWKLKLKTNKILGLKIS